MSAYLSFFVRRNDTFIPIGSYSRSTKIAQVFHDIAPWGKISAIDFEGITRVKEIVVDAEKDVEAHISAIEDRIEFIKSCDVESIDERLESFDLAKEKIEEAESELSEITAARLFVIWLEDIMLDAQYKNLKGFNYKSYVYTGWEIADPTIDDIF